MTGSYYLLSMKIVILILMTTGCRTTSQSQVSAVKAQVESGKYFQALLLNREQRLCRGLACAEAHYLQVGVMIFRQTGNFALAAGQPSCRILDKDPKECEDGDDISIFDGKL